MMEKLTAFTDYLRKIPAAFLVAIMSVLALILFLPDEYARTLAVSGFRDKYRLFLGPAFLLTTSFSTARVFMYFMQEHKAKKSLKIKKDKLHKLTPEEKGYLNLYIQDELNSINVGMDDGVMAGLRAKGITYLASNMGSALEGFAFNLQPWARDYLEENSELLDGYAGRPLTPRQKLHL